MSFAAGGASAASLSWDPDGDPSNGVGGSGLWNTTTLSFDDDGVAPNVAWDNGQNHSAVFGGTGGTVTLGMGITASGLTFGVGGYTVTGSTLTLTGSGGVSVVNAPNMAIIASALAGSAGFSKTGAGTLTISGTNTFTGNVQVLAGTLNFTADGQLGDGANDLLIGSGASVTYTSGSTDWNPAATRTVTIGSGGGSLGGSRKILLDDSGQLAGSGTLTKIGSTILQISGSNAGFTGNMIVQSGQLEVGGLSVANSLGSGAGQTITVQAGAELVANRSVINHAISIGASGATLSGDNGTLGIWDSTLAGSIQTNGNQFTFGLRDFYSPGIARALRVTGGMTGGGNITVAGPNAGTAAGLLWLDNDNTGFSGSVTIGNRSMVRFNGLKSRISAYTLQDGGTVGFNFLNTGGAPVVGAPGLEATYFTFGANAGTGVYAHNYAQEMLVTTPGRVSAPQTEQTIQIPLSSGGMVPVVPVPALGTGFLQNGVLWKGLLNIGTAGSYTFNLPSDDGSLLFIDGQLVVNNDTGHSTPTVAGTTGNLGTLTLTAGYHSIQVKYGQATVNGGISLSYAGPDTGGASILAGSQPNVLFQGSMADSAIGALVLPSGTGTVEITVNASTPLLTLPAASTFNLDSPTISTLNVAATASLTGNVTLAARSGQLNLNGAITESTPSAVTFSGPYLTVLGASNAYSGLTTVSAGQLRLNAAGGNAIPGNLTIAATNVAPVNNVVLAQPGQIADSAVVQLDAGTLDLQANAETIGTLILNGPNARILGSGILTAATYDLRMGEIAAPLAHAGGLSHTVPGTLVLSGSNSYTGLTTLTAGTIIAAHNLALGAGGAGHETTVGATAELWLTGGVTVGETVNLTGTLANFGGNNTLSATPVITNGAVLRAAAGRLTLPAGVSLDGSAGNANVVLTGTGEVVVPGAINLGSGTLTKSGTGTLTFAQTLSSLPSNVLFTGGTLGFMGTQNLGAVSVPAGLAYKFYQDPGAGTTVTVGPTSSLIAGAAIDQAWLSRVAAGSTGSVLLTSDSANALNLVGLGVSLGAADGRTVRLTGAITPDAGGFRFGGGTGTVEVVSALSAQAVEARGRTYLANATNANAGIMVGAGGRLVFNINPQLGAPNAPVTLNNGGVLELAQTSGNSQAIYSQLGNPIAPSVARSIILTGTGGTIDVPASAQAGSGLVITGANTLQGGIGTTLTKTGLGALYVGEAQDFSGNLVIAGSGDRVALVGRGSLQNVASITIGQSGLLLLDNQTGLSGRQWQGAQFDFAGVPLNRVNDNAPVSLNGGRIVFRIRNQVSTANSAVGETLGSVTIGAGQSEIRLEPNGVNGTLSLSNLSRAADGGLVNITTSAGTLGTAVLPSGNHPRLLAMTINGVAPTSINAGGWLVLNSTHFLGYDPTNGLVQASYADQGASAFTPIATSLVNLTTGGSATLNAGNASMNALRFSAGTAQTLVFNTAAQQLNITSGGILSDNQNVARTIGVSVDTGRLTAGDPSATTPQTLFLSANQNTLTVNARVIDNPNNAAAKVQVVKGLDGTVQLNSGANSYSGGTAVYRGTLMANAAGTLGSGGVLVQGLSQVELRAANTVSGSSIANNLPVFTARDGGEVYLNAAAAFNGTNDRFQIAAGATLTGNANSATQGLASLARVSTITGGGQVILAPDAIVRAQNMLPLPELGGFNLQNLGTAADLYFSPMAASGLNDSASLTIGAGTPWKGLSSGRTGAAWAAGTLNANGDFYLQGLARDSAGAALSLGATNTPGTYGIVNRSGQPINAYVSGQVILDEDTAVSMPSDLTFVVGNGGLLIANRSRSFGDPSLRPGSGIASVLVQAGGTLDPGAFVPTGLAANQGLGTPASPAYPYPLESPVNGAATVEMGGRLLLNDAAGLGSSSAVVTMKTGSILELGNAGAFLGSNSGYLNNGRISFQPGVIFRQTASNINHLQAMLDLAPQPVLEIFNGNVSLTNHTNPFLAGSLGNPTIGPENLTLGAGVMLTNDSSDRQLTEGRGKIILASGVTLAAVNQTHLNVQEGMEIQEGAVINVGSAQFIDGLPRLGGIQFMTPNGTILPTSGNFTFNMAEGTQLSFAAANTWPDQLGIHLANPVTAFPAPGALPLLPQSGHSLLLNFDNLVEVMGPLTGNGAVISNVTAGSLGVGWGAAADFTFAGVFSDTNSRGPSLEKVGLTKMTLTGVNTATTTQTMSSTVTQSGEARIWQGELSVSAGGSVRFGTVRLGKSATLTIDNAATAADNRLGQKWLSGQGGTIRLIGHATTTVTERVAQINNGGSPAGSITYLNVETGLAPTRLVADTLERFDVSGGRQTTWVYRSPAANNQPGTYDVDGNYTPNAGNTLTGLFSATNPNFYSAFSFAAVGSNITAAFGTPVAPIRPDYLGDASLTGGGEGFMTQDLAGDGISAFRLLAASEYSSTFWQNSSTNLNVRLNEAVATSGDTRFATLTLAPGSILAINGTLPVNTAPSRVFLNAGGVFVQAGAPSTIDGAGNNIFQAPSNTGLWLHGPGDLNLNATVVSDNNIIKSGSGVLHFGAGAARLWRGTLVIDAGTVNLGANNTFFVNRASSAGNAYNAPSLSLNGGTLNLAGNSQFLGFLNSANPLPYGGAAGGTLTSNSAATVSIQSGGRFSGQITGSISLDKIANNDLILSNLSTYNGATSVRGGNLILRDEGRLSQTAQIELINGTLRLDSGALAKINDRVNPSATINSRGGTLQLDGRAGEIVSQNFAVYNVLEGRNDFNVSAGAGGAGILTFSNFNRAASARAMVSFNQTFGFVGTAGNTTTAIRYLISNLNGSSVALVNNIVAPWMMVAGDSFATYSPVNGIGALGNTADGFAAYDSTDLTTATASQNVSDTTTARTVAASRTVNALRLAPSSAQDIVLNAGVTLTLGSGGLISNANASIDLGRDTASGPQGAITSATPDLYVWVNQNTTTFNTVVTGTINLVKSGPATLELRGNNTHTGVTEVQSGTLTLNTSGADGASVVAVPGELLIRNAAVTETLPHQIRSTVPVRLTGGASLSLRDASGLSETLSSLSLTSDGGGSGSSLFPVVTRASQQLTSSLNLTSVAAITAFSSNASVTPLIHQNVGTVNFTGAANVAQLLNVSGNYPGAGSGVVPVGLVFNAGIGTVPIGVPDGGLVKTGTGLLVLSSNANTNVPSTFGNPLAPTEVFNVQQGVVRVDDYTKLGSLNAITTVQNGAALVFNTGGTGKEVAGSLKFKAGSTLGVSDPTNTGAILGAVTALETEQSIMNVAGDMTVLLGDYFAREVRALSIDIHSRLTGAGAINLLGPTHFSSVGGGGTLTLSNPILTGNPGANDYSGIITVGTNAILQNQVSLVSGNQRATGSALGSAVINLAGGRLRLREDGSAVADASNVSVEYGNAIVLSADSFMDAGRQSSVNGSNNTVAFSTLTVNSGLKTLTVDSVNGYRVSFTQLDGAGHLVKSGAGGLTIFNVAPSYSGDITVAGPRGLSVAPASGLVLPIDTTLTNLTVDGAHSVTSGAYTVNGNLTVGGNAGQVSNGYRGVITGGITGTLSLGGSVMVTTNVLKNQGVIASSAGSGTITVNGGLRGNGLYLANGSPLTLNGTVVDDGATPTTLRVAGSSAVSLTGDAAEHTGGTDVQSGILRVAPVGPALNPLGSAPVRTMAYASSTGTSSTGGTLQFDGEEIVHTGGITNQGAVRISGGTTTITGLVAGTTTTYVPGLLEGRLVGVLDYTENRPANPGNFGIRVEPRMAQMNLVTNDPATGWSSGDMWIYTGEFYDADGKFSFAENVDDSTFLVIDGQAVIASSTFTQVTSSAYTVGQTTSTPNQPGANSNIGGVIANPHVDFGPGNDGWHTFEVRFRNGSGGAGAVEANGFFRNFGFGYAADGATALDGSLYTRPIADPTANPNLPSDYQRALFRTAIGGRGNIELDSGSTLNLGGFAMTGTIRMTSDGGVTTLNLLNAGTHDAVSLLVSDPDVFNGTSPIALVDVPSGATVTLTNLTVDGGIFGKSGNGTIVVAGSGATQSINGEVSVEAGTLEFAGTGSGSGGVTVNGGTFRLTGSLPGNLVVNDGVFSGHSTDPATGVVSGTVTLTGGFVEPGLNGPGLLRLESGIEFIGGGYRVTLNGPAAGTGYDQLSLIGTATFTTNAPLALSLGFNPQDNVDAFTIILNDGMLDGISGAGRFTFGGNPLPEGAQFFVPGAFSQLFTITYAGGDGNDVVLRAIPEPGAAALLLGGLAMLAGKRRRRG